MSQVSYPGINEEACDNKFSQICDTNDNKLVTICPLTASAAVKQPSKVIGSVGNWKLSNKLLVFSFMYKGEAQSLATLVVPSESAENSIFKQVMKMYVCCLLYTSPSPRDRQKSRMPSSA